MHALEAQFPEQEFEEIRHPRVETVDDLALAVEPRARAGPRSSSTRSSSRSCARRCGRSAAAPSVHYCDLLGHPIDAVARVSGQAAQMTPGARQPLDSAYFKRIAAIEFAVKYDDGVGGGLKEADIVLVGVSRTSKTPLSMYLGYLGYKTANVPIVKGIEPPTALFEIDPMKIVGVTIDAQRLAEIRQERARRLGGDQGATRELLEIYEELEEAERGPPAARLPGDRDLGARDRGDRGADHPADRAAAGERRRRRARDRGAAAKPKPPVPWWRWATWWPILRPPTSSSTCC